MVKNRSQAHFQTRRWYDKDPVLSKAMHTLQSTDDKDQIKIALNLIKILIEHKIEQNHLSSVEDLIEAVNTGKEGSVGKGSRWYDINDTVSAAITMLENCPVGLQQKVAVDLAEVVASVIGEQ